MASKILDTYLWCGTLVLLASCANVRPLPGGDKDTTAPVVLMAHPAPLSTRFFSKTIMLEFDEYVALNNVFQELVVSPPLPHPPKIKVKKRTVIIQLQDELLPATTYMFNFGDGIMDVNESNKAQDLIYVFSTGDVIDSLAMVGRVKDAFSDAPAEAYKVLLFENDSTIFSKTATPLYFAKTKEDGSFKLQYLREGDFFMYALDDQNSNYKWEEGEAIALLDSSINAARLDSIPIELSASTPRMEKLVVNNYKTDSVGALSFAIDPFYKEIRVESLTGKSIFQRSAADTLYAWLLGTPTNGMETVRVSCGNALDDTLEIPFFEAPQKEFFKINTFLEKKIKYTDHIELHARSIMQMAEESKISLYQDSLEMKILFDFDSLPSQFVSRGLLKPGKNYRLNILPGAFKNDGGGTNDSLITAFATYKTEDLGSLQFTIKGLSEKSNGRFTLLDKSNTLIYEKNLLQNGPLNIMDIPAGDYTARILEDKNNNHFFDPIALKTKTAPEVVHVFKGKISVRANWQVKVDWLIE